MAGMGGMAEMLRSGDIPPPPSEEGGESSAMSMEEAEAFLQSKGIAPEEFETLVSAVTTIIESQMAASEPEAPAPEEAPPPEDDGLPPI
jgi:hypothetical protein